MTAEEIAKASTTGGISVTEALRRWKRYNEIFNKKEVETPTNKTPGSKVIHEPS